MDQKEFELLVSPLLYARLQTTTETMRTATSAALSTAPFAGLLTDSGRAAAASKIAAAKIRIPGAPRFSWAGVNTNFQKPVLTSEDGALVMLLKQANAVFLDRMRLAVQQRSVCEHAPLFGSMERNAYMLVDHACIVLLPGILVAPFAGERFGDESLFSRIGYVISHEFSHATSDFNFWNTNYARSLLDGYQQSTWFEAAADLGAVVALMGLGVVSNETLCGHLSQIWCARKNALLLDTFGGGWARQWLTHPPPNVRGDLMCAFLEKYYS